jgi:alkylation response protein AidB-like acyl-CoA dehydrogenase
MIFSPDLRKIVDDVFEANAERPAAELWPIVDELGWAQVGVPEEAGGAGGELADVAELAAGIGRHAVGLGLIESGLAGWVLARAGLPAADLGAGTTVAYVPVGRLELMSDGASGDGWRLSGTVPAVRWLPAAPTVVLVIESAGATSVVRVEPAGLGGTRIDADHNLADEPLGTLWLDAVSLPATAVASAPAGLAREFQDRSWLLRAAALSGAMETAVRLTGQHVSTRRQFGKPLAALQAVSHVLADLVVERDLVGAAVIEAIERPDPGTAAVALAVAARGAGVVATGAHQLHGAMGITREYSLHRYSRRLWTWRDEGGTQREAELRVGEQAITGIADAELWALVTGSRA